MPFLLLEITAPRRQNPLPAPSILHLGRLPLRRQPLAVAPLTAVPLAAASLAPQTLLREGRAS